MQPPPRQRTAEEERARAAARQAEKDLWEKTRGAGSAVFKLAESGRIKPRGRSGTHSGQQQQRGNHGDPASSNTTSSGGYASETEQAVVKVKGQDAERADIWSVEDVLPTLKEVESKLYEPVYVHSADILLSRGICDYTLLPKTLGRGKFSTVFVASGRGELHAVKHTALFPHHQLIATRLLREPTLLAELPPHPNLVSVKETIRTPGHFYLVEEYLDGYVTLEALLPLLNPKAPHVLPNDAAERILTQLISAVHAIHVPLQICHRDIKPENILVHPETLQLKLLDFGLATHYSKSEPKLSTCCGSPAFHCPEIVKALASPPGSVMYMGPEVDAWTCGVTMLRCLTGARFPLGATHSSVRGMSIRAQRAVATISDAGLREKVGALLDVDGKRRMKRFEEMVQEQERQHGEANRAAKKFKSTTFIPSTPTHYINLPLMDISDDFENQAGYMSMSASRRTTPSNSRAPSPSRHAVPSSPGGSTRGVRLTALNPTGHPPERVVSFVKYCLRCAGILHHTWADTSGLAKQSRQLDFFSSHVSQPTTGVSAAFAEAVGSPLDAISTPSTPLFPPTFTDHEDRTDGYAHVQVFQCVIEYPEEKEAPSPGLAGQLGQLSLVQSIMAAFSRKPPTENVANDVSNRQQSSARGGVSPAYGPRAQGKRSLSTPAVPRAGQLNAAKNGSASSVATKDGTIRCLAFHLIVRFPQPHHQSFVRQAMSRNPSHMGAGGAAWDSSQQTMSRTNRSRASSAAGALLQSSAIASDSGHGSTKGELDDRSRQSSPTLEVRRQVKIRDDNALPTGTHSALNGAQASKQPPRHNISPSPSRPQSRTRKRSSRGPPKRPRVYFYVSDERAADAVKEALSIGGLMDAQELEDPRRTVHPHTSSTPSLLASELMAGPSSDILPGQAASAPGSRRAGRRKMRDSLRDLHFEEDVKGYASTGDDSGQVTPIQIEDHEHETRGRSLTSGRLRNASADTILAGHGPTTSVGGVRAPSQLSTVALKEESPNVYDLTQTTDALKSTLDELMQQTSVRSSSNASSANQSPHGASTPAGDEGTPIYDGRQTGLLAQTRAHLLDLLKVLHKAEAGGAAALEETINPVSFALFAALSPTLGLVPMELLGLPASTTAPKEANEGGTTLRGMAMSALDLIAHNVSPREMYIAVQERLEVLANAEGKEVDSERSSAAASPTQASAAHPTSNTQDEKGHSPSDAQLHVDIPSHRSSFSKKSVRRVWSGALEVAGLLHVLSIVLPRLKTQKPTGFIEPLVSLVPRTAYIVLHAEVRDRAKQPIGSMTPFSPSPRPHTLDKEVAATTKEEDKEAVSEQQAATCEILLSVLEVCEGVASLAATNIEEAAENASSSQTHLAMLFYASMVALLPDLPKPQGETYLSDIALRRYAPRYDVQPPAAKTKRDALRSVSAIAAQVWQQIRRTVEKLSIDVESQAIEQANPVSRKPGDTTTKAATRTLGAFMLYVNLLARNDVEGEIALTFPRWSSEEALLKLQRALGLLSACLGGGVPAAISKDGLQSFGSTSHLPDAALTYATWCVSLLKEGSTQVPAEDAVILVNTLAHYAASCPRPHARHLSLLLVQDTLQYLTDKETRRELIMDLIKESPYPQLRAASIGIARTLITEELSHGTEDQRAAFMQTNDSSFTTSLSHVLFVLPELPPELQDGLTSDGADLRNDLRSYFDEQGAWLSEVLAFVYLVIKLDHEQNRTGLCSKENLQSLTTELLDPLKALLSRAQEYFAGKRGEDVVEIELMLSLLYVSLDRASSSVSVALQKT